MNARLFGPREDRKTSIVVSVVVHVVVIALIASITFTYPIASLFNNRDLTPAERIHYLQVRPAPAAPLGTTEVKAKPKKVVVAPPPLVAPTSIPTEIPPAPAVATPPAGNPLGVVGGTGTAPAGMATGVEPAMPDPRIELRPNTLRVPMSMAARNDSAVKAIYLAYREAEVEAEAHAGRSPKDWTFERNGGKYGLDSSYIYLGRFKIPSAILAALPFNFGGADGAEIMRSRNAEWIRNDIYTHSQGLSEDDFRAAVRRIRERKDREKREAEEAKAKAQPIVP
ncbi:MAG TPA: hypothetical protein VN706_22360 [Gemmatimonadaceae bacterium]|nr:hypothetical protein [Gemmatimonadaceae bacterium]